jgi:pimeloyl-ACP methyl ester carboxylesterase
MALSDLTGDLQGVLHAMFPAAALMPSLLLVGHSMGGSIIVSLAEALLQPPCSLPQAKIAGVAVLDVVEGTAMAALGSMRNIVLAQPSGFENAEDAVRWHLESGTIRNVDSARRSVPALLKPNDAADGTVAAPSMGTTSIVEEPELEAEEAIETLSSPSITSASLPATSRPTTTAPHALIWRANLLATEPYWRGWFEGLSARFLAVKAPRLLLLAGTDRLDRELMIGQMQGEFFSRPRESAANAKAGRKERVSCVCMCVCARALNLCLPRPVLSCPCVPFALPQANTSSSSFPTWGIRCRRCVPVWAALSEFCRLADRSCLPSPPPLVSRSGRSREDRSDAARLLAAQPGRAASGARASCRPVTASHSARSAAFRRSRLCTACRARSTFHTLRSPGQ